MDKLIPGFFSTTGTICHPPADAGFGRKGVTRLQMADCPHAEAGQPPFYWHQIPWTLAPYQAIGVDDLKFPVYTLSGASV